LESGKMKVQVSEGDLTSFVRTISSSFLSLAESKKIKYNIEIQEPVANCIFDPDKVEKILTNLLSNAFKYTSYGGTVRIKVDYTISSDNPQPESVIFRVEDTGKGIARDDLTKIFDRFYKAGSEGTGEDESTGIGLALTSELVDLLKGTIEVESEVGKGTTFTVTLPVSDSNFSEEERMETPDEMLEAPVVEKEAVLAEQQNDMEGEVPGPGKESLPDILIVEDNQDLRNYISHQLRQGYTILEAFNGKEGLITAFERIPDLIISDLMMPVMGGMEMCRELKNDPLTSHIPIIMLTAKADKRSKLDGLETGADDYIIKPFDAEELQVRVKNLIEQRSKLRDKFRQEFITERDEQAHISPQDQLLQKIMDILNQNVHETEFNIAKMSRELNMSRRQLFRKVHAVTGYTPNDLLRHIRLKEAVSLFDNGQDNITQVMHQVGFNNLSYFAKCFREMYQVNPSDYIKGKAH
jgi:DNA-binding response OmpR family regulator/two-component sensor histidine kinase